MCIRDSGDEAAQLNIQMLGHALDSAGHIGQLADAGGLDDDAVGVVLLHHLLQSGAEIAHQRDVYKRQSRGWRASRATA